MSRLVLREQKTRLVRIFADAVLLGCLLTIVIQTPMKKRQRLTASEHYPFRLPASQFHSPRKLTFTPLCRYPTATPLEEARSYVRGRLVASIWNESADVVPQRELLLYEVRAMADTAVLAALLLLHPKSIKKAAEQAASSPDTPSQSQTTPNSPSSAPELPSLGIHFADTLRTWDPEHARAVRKPIPRHSPYDKPYQK